MTADRPSPMIRLLRQAALSRDAGGGTDGELLGGFVARRDGAALEALIRRHGPMVLAVCRRVLGNDPDAEDAFQAAFLVFVRKAASIRARELVGNWLYGVAYRTALKARSAAARRRAKERRAATMTPTRADDEEDWAELLPLLDRELSRLPEKYRIPLVLCELEGRSRKEAAGKLGVPEGTLSSRLATGRRMLARRLTPHRTGSAGCGLTAALARASAGTGVPPPLLASTAKAASLFTAGQTATAVVSARVAALAEGVLKTMLLMKLTVGFLAVVAVVASAAVVFACRPPAPPAQAPPAVSPSPAPATKVDKPEVKKVEPEWGEAVDGVQARLRPTKTAWDAGETPEFILDMRNRGEQTPHQCRVPNFCEIEWDGQWYRFGGSGDLDCKAFFLNPGKEIDDWVKMPLDIPWVRKKGDKEERLQVAPGKHTVRVAFLFDGGGRLGDVPRPVSQPVEIEVGKESAWGEAVDGVQARLRAPKAVWKAGEAPTFILDLRNEGKNTPNARRVPVDCQIEVDGTWYSYDIPSGPYPTVVDLLEPGKQINGWTTVSPDKYWGSITGKKEHLPLPHGKHTRRIGYWLQGTPNIRPESGPVEIEVREDGAK